MAVGNQKGEEWFVKLLARYDMKPVSDFFVKRHQVGEYSPYVILMMGFTGFGEKEPSKINFPENALRSYDLGRSFCFHSFWIFFFGFPEYQDNDSYKYLCSLLRPEQYTSIYDPDRKESMVCIYTEHLSAVLDKIRDIVVALKRRHQLATKVDENIATFVSEQAILKAVVYLNENRLSIKKDYKIQLKCDPKKLPTRNTHLLTDEELADDVLFDVSAFIFRF